MLRKYERKNEPFVFLDTIVKIADRTVLKNAFPFEEVGILGINGCTTYRSQGRNVLRHRHIVNGGRLYYVYVMLY